MATQQQSASSGRQYNGYAANGAPAPMPVPGAIPLLPNQGRVIQSGPTRILCVADVRGNLKSLNDLAKAARADYIIHTGDFGFYDERSLDRIAEKTLKHVAQYSPLISEEVRRQVTMAQGSPSIKERFSPAQLPLSQLPQFLNGTYSFDVPVYTVWGACEDVQVLEKLRSQEYKVDKLHVIDEAHSRLIEVGGVKLRLLGLGGAVVMHKLFDNGEGRTTIAGGQGTMWTTLLQMGELVDTANRVYDPSETRVLVTHASPAREGLLNQLAVHLKVDFSISAALHFRYGSSYNEFSVNPTLDHYRGKLAASKASFNDVWETVKGEVEPAVQDNEAQKRLLQNAIDVVEKMPSVANGGNPFGGSANPGNGVVDEVAFKNMWNFNLADAAFGWLVLEVEGGRIGTEMKAQGFNFAHRGVKPAPTATAGSAQTDKANTLASSPVPQTSHGAPAPAQPAARAQAPVAPQAPAQGRQSQQRPVQTNTAIPSVAANGAPTDIAATSTLPLASSDAKINGAGTTDDVTKETPPPAERKPSDGLFINGAVSEEAARNMVPEPHRGNIQRVEARGRSFVVHFGSPEEAQSALKDVLPELLKGGPGKPSVREFLERGNSRYVSGQRWENNRPPTSGYRSGGDRASDSEGGRGGRGGFRGGRGGRGGERGGRGGRGRGGFAKGGPGEGGPAPTPGS